MRKQAANIIRSAISDSLGSDSCCLNLLYNGRMYDHVLINKAIYLSHVAAKRIQDVVSTILESSFRPDFSWDRYQDALDLYYYLLQLPVESCNRLFGRSSSFCSLDLRTIPLMLDLNRRRKNCVSPGFHVHS